MLENFLDTANFGLSVVDCNLRYIYVNDLIAKLNNKPIDQHIGRLVSEVRPDITENELSAYRRVIESGDSVLSVEIEVPRNNSGSSDYWSMNFHPIKSQEGRLLAVGTSVRNITKRKMKEFELDERLRFEGLLSQLSTIFVNLPAAEIDSKICDALKSIVEFLGFDRSAISEFSSDQTKLTRTHSYSLPGVAMSPNDTLSEELPQWVKSIRRGVSSFSNPGDLPDSSWREKAFCEALGYKSIISIPLKVGGSVLGAVVFTSSHSERKWPEDIIRRLRLVGEIFASALERKRAEQKLEKAFLEIKELKDRLEVENIYLRDEIGVMHKHEEIIGQSSAIRKSLNLLEQVATTDSTVLILGETGTGKELLARAIHNLSSRKGKAMVKVNCAALPATLIESELFGREKGAYTGALTRQIGRFEAAHGSTIFLDEIGELPLELQAKLLRVLQEGQLERLGSTQTLTVNVRVVAATNRDLAQAVKEGKFREDLYYRLNVFPISVPPLRDRREDIPLLIWTFVKEFSGIMGKTIESISKPCMDACQRYSWPGNVRELRNVVERAMIMSKDSTLRIDLPISTGLPTLNATNLEEVERQYIQSVMENSGWRVRGKGGAAEVLGLKPTTLDSKLLKLNIKRGHAHGGHGT
jgi:PAS domain S-box-containing protein